MFEHQPVFMFFIFPARSYELVRNQIELGDILGEGQFGDVHKGTYRTKDGALIPVAVKTCKGDADLATTEKFLEEACKHQTFQYYTSLFGCGVPQGNILGPQQLFTLPTMFLRRNIHANFESITRICTLGSASRHSFGTAILFYFHTNMLSIRNN